MDWPLGQNGSGTGPSTGFVWHGDFSSISFFYADNPAAFLYQSRVNALLQQLPGVNFRIWSQQAQDRSFWASAVKALCIVPQTRSVGRAFDALCLAVFRVGTPKVYSGTLLKNMQLANLLDVNFVARILPCAQCGQWFKSKAALGIHDTQTSINHGLALPPLIIFIYSTVWKGT